MSHRVITDFERPDPRVLERLRRHAAPVNYAGHWGIGQQTGLDAGIRPINEPTLPMFGVAFTVLCSSADILMPLYAIELAQPGDVLVIDAGGERDVAVWGGSTTRSSLLRGLAGVVVDGAVIDTGALRHGDALWRFPVYARGAAPAYGSFDQPGSINVPVRVGGRVICPGDVVVGNDDGVAFIPRSLTEEAATRAEEFLALAEHWQRELSNGKTWFETLQLQAVLDRLGISISER